MQTIDIITSPWCIMPSKLVEIQEIYQARMQDKKIDLSQFQAIVDNRKSTEQDKRYQLINNMAIVDINGVMAKKMNMFHMISGGVSTQLVGDDISEALRDDDVHGILLNVDSPGGAVDGTQELGNIIFEGKRKKPIVVYSDGMIASGAYWISSAADAIYISGNTNQVGSIGVVVGHRDYSRQEEMQGIKTTEITSGKYKRIASAYERLSVEGKQDLQESSDYLYSVFVNEVAKNRRVSVETVLSKMADGKVFIGQQAVNNGLVDGIATFEQTMQELSILCIDKNNDSELMKLNELYKR